MILLAILTLLQLVDGWTTYRIIKRGGSEKNPVVKKLIEKFGLYTGLVIAKSFAVVMFIVLLLLSTPTWILLGVIVFYVWVAVHNIQVLQK